MSKDLGTRGASDVNSSLRAGEVEVKCPSSYSEKRKQTWNPPAFSFFSTQTLNRLGDAHPHCEGQCIYWVPRFKCSSHPGTPAQTHPEMMLHLGPLWPVKLTHKINHLSDDPPWFAPDWSPRQDRALSELKLGKFSQDGKAIWCLCLGPPRCSSK